MAYQFPAGVTTQQRNRIVDAFCTQFGYPSTPIPDTNVTGDNTNADRLRFFQLCVRRYIHGVNRGQRSEAAGAAARAAEEATADADTVGLD